MTRASVCKRCNCAFEQPRIQGRPLEFCSYRCKLAERNESQARRQRERYQALRAAQVPAPIALKACGSPSRFNALMRGRSNVESV